MLACLISNVTNRQNVAFKMQEIMSQHSEYELINRNLVNIQQLHYFFEFKFNQEIYISSTSQISEKTSWIRSVSVFRLKLTTPNILNVPTLSYV